MAYNTAVSSLMILANSMDDRKSITKDDYHLLLTLLNPIAPHITEELNEMLVKHELWLKNKGGEQLNLENVDLRDFNLNNANLEKLLADKEKEVMEV